MKLCHVFQHQILGRSGKFNGDQCTNKHSICRGWLFLFGLEKASLSSSLPLTQACRPILVVSVDRMCETAVHKPPTPGRN